MPSEEDDVECSHILHRDSDYYRLLKEGKISVEVRNGKFLCPFCEIDDVQGYSQKELARHCSDFFKRSDSSASDGRAQHGALLKYVEGRRESENGDKEGDGKGMFVWPWMGIVASLPEFRDGRQIGESGSKLRDDLARRGFFPAKVVPLWDRNGFSGYSVVHFRRDWNGFKDAMEFQRKFECEGKGKREWASSTRRHGRDAPHGWIATADDFNGHDLIARHLRKNGDLKRVSDLEREQDRKHATLYTDLHNVMQEKDLQFEAVQSELDRTESSIAIAMRENDKMHKSFNEDLGNLQRRTQRHLQNIIRMHGDAKSKLEGQRKELVGREKELDRREALNEDALKKLDEEKQMIENAVAEQKRASENVLRLGEAHQAKKEELRRKAIELEKQLDAKQALELQIERLKGAREVMKHMSGGGGESEGESMRKKLEEVEGELADKEERLELLESMNQTLVVKERNANTELQDARKELMSYYPVEFNAGRSSKVTIGVKRMGDLETQPFIIASRRKYHCEQEANEKALESCSYWEKLTKDPDWYPFRVIERDGAAAELILRDDDERIVELKEEYGEEVHAAVVKSLMELNEHNPSGRYPVPQLWNFPQGRKATLVEALQPIVARWRKLPRRV